jgi:dihydrofolate reductase
MSKIIVSNLLSLDGFIADANGDLGWFRADEEFLRYARELCRSLGGILFGRRTYEMLALIGRPRPASKATRSSPNE